MRTHSVLLKPELCAGCTNCVKNCPTKAIRVHQGKATIRDDLCIDCAECIRTCAYHAKYSQTGTLEDLREFAYPVVLVPPSFYGQFRRISPFRIRAALQGLGFREVFDAAAAAQELSRETARFLAEHRGTFISSSCPVVVRLVLTQYPELAGQLLPLKPPVEALAEQVRIEAQRRGVTEGELGVFFITPCPAKNTSIHYPLGMERSFIDGTIASALVFQGVQELLRREGAESGTNGALSDQHGLSWGFSGGEVSLLGEFAPQSISVSGIHRVQAFLAELSRGSIKGVRYCELTACAGGCVGGVFHAANVFQGGMNLRRWAREAQAPALTWRFNFQLDRDFKPVQLGQLDSDLERAVAKLNQLEQEIASLPGLDCAACGAPDCRTLAEDIVAGLASRSHCVFLLRKEVGELADQMSRLVHALPPVMKGKESDGK